MGDFPALDRIAPTARSPAAPFPKSRLRRFEAAGTELVDRVLYRVVEDVVVAVVDVDDVGHGDAALHKGKVVVVHACSLSEKMRLIASRCL